MLCMPLHLLRHAQLDLTVSNKDFGWKVTYHQLDPGRWPTNSHFISSLVASAMLCNSISAKTSHNFRKNVKIYLCIGINRCMKILCIESIIPSGFGLCGFLFCFGWDLEFKYHLVLNLKAAVTTENCITTYKHYDPVWI